MLRLCRVGSKEGGEKGGSADELGSLPGQATQAHQAKKWGKTTTTEGSYEMKFLRTQKPLPSLPLLFSSLRRRPGRT